MSEYQRVIFRTKKGLGGLTKKEQYSIWIADNLGEKIGERYAPYLEKLGFLLAEFNLCNGCKENFFDYENYEDFKPVYQQIISQTDAEISEILKGSNNRYPKSYASQKIIWKQQYAKYTYEKGQRASPDNLGGIIDFGVILRSYLRFLYYQERPALIYPKNENELATWEGSLDDSINYWAVSVENEHLFEGFVALEVGYLADFRQYESRAAIESVIAKKRRDSRRPVIYSKAVWEFCHEMQFGDVVYAKIGAKKIVGRGIVIGDYNFDSTVSKNQHTRKVVWTEKGEWELPEPITTKYLTLFNPYPEWLTATDELINGEITIPTTNAKYATQAFLAEVFIDKQTLNRLISLLKNKKNLILQGAPGVGKTFIAKRLAYVMMQETDDDRISMIQFHQSYSYEDFIEGYRPNVEGEGFKLKAGPFINFANQAADDPKRDYFLIIDEINRGNLSKIFGELMMLIEADKRQQSLDLLYSNQPFSVPENLYIIGMMNTADRSLALLDYALRRRFAFFELEPAFANPTFVNYLKNSAQQKNLPRLIEVIKSLNLAIEAELGKGFKIGHSYFVGEALNRHPNERLVEIVEYEIIPQLHEYWFDDFQKANNWAMRLRECCENG